MNYGQKFVLTCLGTWATAMVAIYFIAFVESFYTEVPFTLEKFITMSLVMLSASGIVNGICDMFGMTVRYMIRRYSS